MRTRLLFSSGSLARDIKCIRAAPERVEAGCDLFGSSNFDDCDVKAECTGGYLNIADLQYAGWIFNIHEDCQSPEAGNHLLQKLKSLASKIGLLIG
jgi:hypothetical protein